MLRILGRFLERHPLLMAMGEAVGIGLQSIRAYKMRAFLTPISLIRSVTETSMMFITTMPPTSRLIAVTTKVTT